MDDIRIVGEQDQAVAPLPVQLMSFKGSVQGANVNLTWATAQELDNDKFVVERSLDGRSFSEIGKVTGRGNSSTRINYTFTDTNPAEGINYYRLRQVDFDGAEETSNVVALQFKGTQHTLNGNIAKVYPTITSSDVTVSFALRNAQVTVLNANGQQVAQYGNVNNAVVVPAAHLHPGIYFVKVSDGTQQQTQRFVKQ
ncbi:T9SS type A sorting domain-containing protein [Pontibacter anaerobius]|uniref:T9SS type A sorting domain-containing protein n=1 Tax=Pontibacter anaerobius TaxID=2993940 RepID=A0ABT3RFM6_9BACT|nr:T9SS type A sorting domain-containing protein [Pontibacter anaerobius]MCX2740651.1 T9SS type A sorting domain-containing protein [Pontibacter anaerobius]